VFPDGEELTVTLQKGALGKTWGAVFAAHAALDAVKTEADRKQIMLERFQAENPGFDFSGAEFSGAVGVELDGVGGREAMFILSSLLLCPLYRYLMPAASWGE
jgi:hypothetical protein